MLNNWGGVGGGEEVVWREKKKKNEEALSSDDILVNHLVLQHALRWECHSKLNELLLNIPTTARITFKIASGQTSNRKYCKKADNAKSFKHTLQRKVDERVYGPVKLWYCKLKVWLQENEFT